MNKMQDKVAEFHKAFGVPVNTTPQGIAPDRLKLRASLIFEEAFETIVAMGCRVNIGGDSIQQVENCESSLPDVTDGLADLLYVTFGACLELGIDIQAVFDCVHESNMSKMWTTREMMEYHKTADDYVFTAMRLLPEWTEKLDERIYSCKRKDGKIIKSPSYSPVDIKSVLEKLKGK